MKKITCLIIVAFALMNFSLNAGDKPSAVKKFDYLTELNRDFKTAYGKTAKYKDVLKDKTILLYFTASWCPPCRSFTPVLVKFAEANADSVVVVVVSRDRTKTAAVKYMKNKKAKIFFMIPPGKQSNKLATKFEIRGIPNVTVIGKDGAVLSSNGRGIISRSDKLPAEWK